MSNDPARIPQRFRRMPLPDSEEPTACMLLIYETRVSRIGGIVEIVDYWVPLAWHRDIRDWVFVN